MQDPLGYFGTDMCESFLSYCGRFKHSLLIEKDNFPKREVLSVDFFFGVLMKLGNRLLGVLRLISPNVLTLIVFSFSSSLTNVT